MANMPTPPGPTLPAGIIWCGRSQPESPTQQLLQLLLLQRRIGVAAGLEPGSKGALIWPSIRPERKGRVRHLRRIELLRKVRPEHAGYTLAC